jgi:glycosyltransferase A (GT-A) superfamily protein (DUF2064 family)
VTRTLVLFAREPTAEAREKGLACAGGAALFRSLAQRWRDAAAKAGASLIVATPPEDLARWRAALSESGGVSWIPQRGENLGVRLEDAARRAASLVNRWVIAGGDVAPSEALLNDAFEALEGGADAVLSPAPDGGVSLLALSNADLDLLRGIRPRRRTVFGVLLEALKSRGRRVSIIRAAADFDGPRSLRALLRTLPAGDDLRSILKAALACRIRTGLSRVPPLRAHDLWAPTAFRAPPASLAV